MVVSRSAVHRAIAIFVLAPICAAGIIVVLLLIGVSPHLVFLPGHAVKSGLETLGIHAHNRVGVLCTVLFWWGIVVIVGSAVRRLSRRNARL